MTAALVGAIVGASISMAAVYLGHYVTRPRPPGPPRHR